MDVQLSSGTREALDDYNLAPLWEIERGPLGGERDQLEPDVWKWKNIQDAIDRIADDVPVSALPPGFQRRVAVPTNPTYDAAISHTLYVGVQMVSPGEVAPSHRHGANAMRFVIDSTDQMRTIVDDETLAWSEKDSFVVPPGDPHHHEADEDAIVLAITDRPVFDGVNLYYEKSA